MPALMIDDRQGITASWTIFQWHISPIAGFGAIASADCATSVREKLAEGISVKTLALRGPAIPSRSPRALTRFPLRSLPGQSKRAWISTGRRRIFQSRTSQWDACRPTPSERSQRPQAADLWSAGRPSICPHGRGDRFAPAWEFRLRPSAWSSCPKIRPRSAI